MIGDKRSFYHKLLGEWAHFEIHVVVCMIICCYIYIICTDQPQLLHSRFCYRVSIDSIMSGVCSTSPVFQGSRDLWQWWWTFPFLETRTDQRREPMGASSTYLSQLEAIKKVKMFLIHLGLTVTQIPNRSPNITTPGWDDYWK